MFQYVFNMYNIKLDKIWNNFVFNYSIKMNNKFNIPMSKTS